MKQWFHCAWQNICDPDFRNEQISLKALILDLSELLYASDFYNMLSLSGYNPSKGMYGHLYHSYCV